MYPHYIHQEPHERLPLPDCIDAAAVRRQGKQIIDIILLNKELMHDIEEGIRQVENGRDKDAPKLLPSDGNESYTLRRHIDSAINMAVSRCQAYLLLPSPYVRRISTDHVDQWLEKDIILGMPHNWPPHCVDSLRDAVHNYIVNRAMQLFLTLSEPKAAEICGIQADSCYNDINAQLNTRLGPTRIHPTFLG